MESIGAISDTHLANYVPVRLLSAAACRHEYGSPVGPLFRTTRESNRDVGGNLRPPVNMEADRGYS
jgi:hypothetical protein